MTEDTSTHEEKAKIRKPVRINPQFKHEVLSMPGGETLKMCFQCGTCTSGCIIADYTDSYRPRTLIRLAQLGLPDRILPSETLWLCATCYTCTDQCPQGVEVKDVIRVLQNLAVKKGYIPNAYIALSKNILSTGLAHKIGKFKLKKRSEKGLPPIPEPSISEIEKLAKITGFFKTISEAKA